MLFVILAFELQSRILRRCDESLEDAAVLAAWSREHGADGKVGIEIGAGKDAPNRIDGITGATMTCDKVEDMLNEAIRALLGSS